MTSPVTRWLFARCGVFVRGATLHRAALAACHAGEHATAAALFERAARAYRRDLDVCALARLRIHEGIARLRAAGGADAATLAAEVEQLLGRLDEIESPEPPFAPVPARDLLETLPGRAAPAAARAA